MYYACSHQRKDGKQLKLAYLIPSSLVVIELLDEDFPDRAEKGKDFRQDVGEHQAPDPSYLKMQQGHYCHFQLSRVIVNRAPGQFPACLPALSLQVSMVCLLPRVSKVKPRNFLSRQGCTS